jgi:hypothetical protein
MALRCRTEHPQGTETNNGRLAARTNPELWQKVKAEVTHGAKSGTPGQ